MNYAPTKWVRVTKRNPCPICERPDWCGITADGTAVRCMRVQSGRPSEAKDGEMGWIHQVADPIPVQPRQGRRQAPIATIDWEAMLGRWRMDTQPGQYRELATRLGVTVGSLIRLGTCYDAERRAWAFPMKNEWWQVTGIRLRNQQARKWAVTGSKQGVFWPDMHTAEGPIVLVEGPTDTAAMLDLGYDAFGRPSCSGGAKLMLEILSRGPIRDVVIVADRDEAKTRPDGSAWYPGQEGAQALARSIMCVARSVRVIKPLKGKDARAWVQAGATRAVVDAVIASARYWRP